METGSSGVTSKIIIMIQKKNQTMRVQIQRLDESTHVCVSKTGQVRQEVDD